VSQRGKKYHFQKGEGINIISGPKYRPLLPVGNFLTFPTRVILAAIQVTCLLSYLCCGEDIYYTHGYISDPSVVEQILAYNLIDLSLYLAEFL
jgi:hypothetical protein